MEKATSRRRKPRRRNHTPMPPKDTLGYATHVANAYADDIVEHRVKIGDLERAILNNDVAMSDLLEGARLERAEMLQEIVTLHEGYRRKFVIAFVTGLILGVAGLVVVTLIR